MTNSTIKLLLLAASIGCTTFASSVTADWPEFRGPTGQGISTATGLAVEWSPTKNVAWKVAVPGAGWTSPAISSGRIFLTTGVTKTAEVWRLGGADFNDSISMPVVHDGFVFATDTPGYVYCIDSTSGKKLWMHDVKSNIWGSPLVADGKVFVQNSEGAVVVFAAGREKKILATNTSLPDVQHGTPVAANGVLYLAGQKHLFAIAAGK